MSSRVLDRLSYARPQESRAFTTRLPPAGTISGDISATMDPMSNQQRYRFGMRLECERWLPAWGPASELDHRLRVAMEQVRESFANDLYGDIRELAIRIRVHATDCGDRELEAMATALMELTR